MSTIAHEQLTDGWETDAPVGDTLLRRYLFCWASVCETFARTAGGRTVIAPGFAAADYRRPSGWFNSATLLRPPSPETFDEVEAFFAGGTGEAHLWSAWPVPDLSARGWQLVGHPPLLMRPPAALVPPPPPPPVDVVDVTDPEGLADWERVAIEGYPLPELRPPNAGSLAHASLLAEPRLHFSLGRQSAHAVSLGALFVDYGVGCFVLGVTRPDARRRGHWRAHAVRRLWAAPDVWMTGVFSDYSRSPAERLGFVPLLRLTLWRLPRP